MKWFATFRRGAGQLKTLMLIGGMASGKSTVSRMFASFGFTCIDLDKVGHDVLLDDSVAGELANEFGQDVLIGGKIDRPSLAKAAFASKHGLKALNSITHPRIIARAVSRLREFESEGCELVLLEVSAFDGPEGSFADLLALCEGVVAVVAPEEQRIARAIGNGFAEDDARRRISRQPNDDQRLEWADFVIENVGSEQDLRSQVVSTIGKMVG